MEKLLKPKSASENENIMSHFSSVQWIKQIFHDDDDNINEDDDEVTHDNNDDDDDDKDDDVDGDEEHARGVTQHHWLSCLDESPLVTASTRSS